MTESRFFDIDAILMEEEKLRVELLLDAANMDSLEYSLLSLTVEPSARARREPRIAENSEDELKTPAHIMPAGTKFQTPLWLALGLSMLKYVRVQLPKWYGSDFMHLALADPEVANLHAKNAYFYEVGAVLARKLESAKITDFLSEVLLARIKRLILLVLHSSKQEHQSAFVHKLTGLESRFYEQGLAALSDYRSWRGGKLAQVNQERVLSTRKRLKLG